MTANYLHLRAFHAIATEGSVSRAARRLNISQPTLSQQLKALETRHGVTLFESRKTPLRLTAAGQDLFALTGKMFAVAADIDHLLSDSATITGGLLRLGSDNPTYAARIVDRFRRRHPQAELTVRMGNAQEVMTWLCDAQVDVAVASDPPGEPNLHYEALASDGLACAVSTDHGWASFSAVPIDAFGQETLLLRERTSKTRAYTERVLVDAGIKPRATLEVQSREMIRECVALKMGVSIFFSSECPPDARIVYRPLAAGGRLYELRSYLVCREERRRSVFMRELQEIAADLRAGSDE